MKPKVEVVPYDPAWPFLFEKEAALIRSILGPNCVDIHHIGSTAVKNLSAKPIIDIIPCVKSLSEVDKVIEDMEKAGYVSKGEHGICFRRFFQKKGKFNLHIFEKGNTEIERHLKFRDWIRTHEKDRIAYENLKKDLAAKYPEDILSYCFEKEAFIRNVDLKDGYRGHSMVKAVTPLEWKAVNELLGEEPSDKTFLVFYKNGEIVGVLEHDPIEKRAKKIAVDKESKSLFSELYQRWLKPQLN